MKRDEMVNLLIKKTNDNEIAWKRIALSNFFNKNKYLTRYKYKNKITKKHLNLEDSYYTKLNDGFIFILTRKSKEENSISLNI